MSIAYHLEKQDYSPKYKKKKTWWILVLYRLLQHNFSVQLLIKQQNIPGFCCTNTDNITQHRERSRTWGRPHVCSLDILFWKSPWNFSFFYFNPGNSIQNKAPLWKFHKFLLDLGNSKIDQKSKDPWLKFHFSWLLLWKFHVISLIDLEFMKFSYPQLRPLFSFFWNSALCLFLPSVALFCYFGIVYLILS